MRGLRLGTTLKHSQTEDNRLLALEATLLLPTRKGAYSIASVRNSSSSYAGSCFNQPAPVAWAPSNSLHRPTWTFKLTVRVCAPPFTSVRNLDVCACPYHQRHDRHSRMPVIERGTVVQIGFNILNSRLPSATPFDPTRCASPCVAALHVLCIMVPTPCAAACC